jgi:pimeloyl-ACP methyl ester carboxylesterase
MLALAYAAEWPTTIAAIVLVGCGTFSDRARAAFEARYAARLTSAHHAELTRIEGSELDADRRLAALGRLSTQVYGYDLEDAGPELDSVDAVAHREAWSDMLRLQRNGTYPAAFAAIRCPMLMLHGDADPHPGAFIYEDLRAHMPHLEYRELQRCGHSPWLERQARPAFVEHLETWLVARSPSREAG